MHRLRPFLTIPVGVIIVVLAVANRHDVTVSLFPLPWDIEAPLYALMILMFALGAIAGGLAMWTGRLKRQRKQRAKAVRRAEKEQPAKVASPLLRGPTPPSQTASPATTPPAQPS